MPEYLSPAVYIEEIPGAKPIEGVGTSTGAFVGIAEKGPIGSPQLVTNFSQFRDAFGGFLPNAYLAYSVQHFFIEGGTRCYVVRTFRPNAVTPENANPDLANVVLRKDADPQSEQVLTVFAATEGAWGNNIFVRVEKAGFDANDPKNELKRFKLKVFLKQPDKPIDPSNPIETFDQLSMNEHKGTSSLPNPDHVESKINGISKYIKVKDATEDPTKIDPPFIPADPAPPLLLQLTGGTDGLQPGTDAATSLVPADLIGSASTDTTPATGLYAFDSVDDINIVAIPDLIQGAFNIGQSRDAVLAGITYCENRQDCFFVADPPKGSSPQDVLKYKQGTKPEGNPFNSSYGALYYPWIYVTDPLSGKRKLCPPSGAVAGSYSAADVRRGVHKAPAGTIDGYLNAAVDIERIVTKGEHDTLNPEGINVIRKFPDAGICIWGARTVSADAEWKYVNVRRLFMFLEESIEEGTQWVVFEPNDYILWKKIIRDISAFLRIQWLEGKLVGQKAEQAFFVKCDAETNPPESVDLGRVITMIGVAPSKPAEFVIFRIQQIQPGEAPA